MHCGHHIGTRAIVAIALCSIACKEPPSPGDLAKPSAAGEAPRKIDLAAITSSISASDLRRHVAYLASDRLEGRGAGSRGLVLAADYLEEKAREIGLEPAFGDRFRQPFVMTIGARLGEKNELSQPKARSLRIGKDFVPFTFSSTGTVEGPIAFAGYGIRAPELSYDDFAEIDAKGKILVMLSGEPSEDSESSPFDGKKTSRYSELRRKVLSAREAGAKAVLVVRDKLRLPGPSVSAEADSGIVALQVSEGAAKVLLGFDLAKVKAEIDATNKPKSRAPDRSPVKATASIVRDRRSVDNVAAVLVPPSKTATEAVVIGAHYDHLGLGGSSSLAGTDRPQIHNGADDNASGAAALLEIARALKRDTSGLRRKIVFIWFAGEESGLLGSAHFVRNSPLPVEAIVSMVNLDMVGRLRNNRVHVLGVDSAVELRSLAERAVTRHDVTGVFGGDAYGPSDHTSFYARGVPVLFLFTGAHENYHRPSDDPETLNYPGEAKVAAIAADLMRAIASTSMRPTYAHLPAPPPSSGRGYGPYFGSIPDFAESTDGVPLSGVRKGSPAEKAGVQGGDVILRFGGVRTKSLQDFTQVLRDKAPGDEVEVEVLRDGGVVTLKAKLEKRSEE
jgi:aminopeptidase YwaD